MISKTELKSIDTQYFNILQLGCFAVYVQSKNTNHFWAIHVEEYPTFRHFKIYHKHNSYEEYHRHRDTRSINAAIEYIKSHDAFQLNGRRPVKNYAS
ncbi:MAG: hypothetical protein K0S01_2774 [Herbinix sp.]|jgi:hypothetical protein|nr:hypothetical protein [Herbinix sp.]